MAHLAKFEGGIVGKKMYMHWAREKDEKGEYATYNRADGGGHIDRNRTKDNFTIGEIQPYDWIKTRLKNVYQKPGQKHPIESCDIVVTLPQEEEKTAENIKKFFETAYESLKNQYGKNNNIIGAWVHLDEAQPHMHFAFLPISERNSKQKPEFKEKLSTRAYWPSKNSLQKMHDTLQKDMDKGMGRHVIGIYDGRTKEQGGNKTILELKKETVEQKERLERLKTKPEELKELEGEYKNPTFGGDYYKLTPHQYKRLRTLAQNSIQEHDDNIILSKKNEELQSQNNKLNEWVNFYIRKNKEEAEKGMDKEFLEQKNEIKMLQDELAKADVSNYNLEHENKKIKKDLSTIREENAKMEKFISVKGLMKEFKKFGGKSVSFALGKIK